MHIEKGPYIQLEDVNFSYGNNQVLGGVSFDVEKGDYLGIIGPNGGGKTTLLKIILGLVEPDSGVVRIMGHDIHNLKDRSVIGYVPQRIGAALHPFPATVEEVVASGRIVKAGILKRFTREDRSAIEYAIEIAGIKEYRKRLIGNLSGGEIQKVFIARALAGEPKILILDEPTTGVDVGSQKKFYEFWSNLNHEHHLTIVFVSHDINVVSSEAKTIICLNRNLVCEGPADKILKEDVIKKLYGDEINVVVHQH